MKYFFLSEGWEVSRVWEFGGLWDQAVWRRPPQIEQLNIKLVTDNEILWLYRVEDPVLMVEVKPRIEAGNGVIGQVVLKRLMNGDQAIARLDEEL